MRSLLVQKFSGTLPWGLIQILLPLFPETIFCSPRWEPTGWAGSCCSEEEERAAGLTQPSPLRSPRSRAALGPGQPPGVPRNKDSQAAPTVTRAQRTPDKV